MKYKIKSCGDSNDTTASISRDLKNSSLAQIWMHNFCEKLAWHEIILHFVTVNQAILQKKTVCTLYYAIKSQDNPATPQPLSLLLGFLCIGFQLQHFCARSTWHNNFLHYKHCNPRNLSKHKKNMQYLLQSQKLICKIPTW